MNADKFKVDPKEWEETLKEVEASERGRYLFPEVGQTRVRLLVSPERIATMFYHPVVTTYFDKARTRFMFPVLVADSDWNYQLEVKYAVMPKTVLKEILTILVGAEYELFHPSLGHGITINRTGEGLRTKYSVIPSREPVPIDYDQLEFEGILSDIAQEFMDQVAEDKAAKEQEEEGEELPF